MPAADVLSHALPEGFHKVKAHDALTALIDRAVSASQNTLFTDATTRILMDVTAFKIPEAKEHFFNITLPHRLYPEDVDILLVIPDDVKTKTEPEHLVAQVKDRLPRALPNLKIREVMTLKQLKDEYSTYEGKRQVIKNVDLVLADSRVFKSVLGILGRECHRKKKFPLGIPLDPEFRWFNRQDFERALKKSVFNMSAGLTSTIVVGQTHLTASELTENVSKITNWLSRSFPGGWANIQKLSLYTTGIPPLIVYQSTGTRNDVEGRAFGRLRKRTKPEEDELSTMPGRRVRVHLDGKIRVLKDDVEEGDEELIEFLGVEEELTSKRIRNDVYIEPEIKKRSRGKKVNLEEAYVDEVAKREAEAEDIVNAEPAEADGSELEDEAEESRPKKKKEKRKNKGKNVTN